MFLASLPGQEEEGEIGDGSFISSERGTWRCRAGVTRVTQGHRAGFLVVGEAVWS